MKILKILSILYLFIFFDSISMANNYSSIFDFDLIDIDGKKIELSKFEGKPILLVNTASRCGFTPQYEGLQNLFLKYKKTDLTIIATTSNSFNQEYEDPEKIKKICLVNYEIGFIASSPIDVKGEKAHPIYAWINEQYEKKPKWNFYKYLFDRNGKLIDSWWSNTKPDSKKIIKRIDALL